MFSTAAVVLLVRGRGVHPKQNPKSVEICLMRSCNKPPVAAEQNLYAESNQQNRNIRKMQLIIALFIFNI